MTARPPAPRVVVAVPTYRRVDALTRLLESLVVRVDVRAYRARVLVVDNDPDRSAEPVVAQIGADYVSEPRAGIGAARHRILEECSGADVVVMLDDDLLPGAEWLAPLVDTWRRTAASVVVGHVRYVWPPGTPPWIESGGYMRRVHRPDGAPLGSLSTGSVLIDIGAARRLGVQFDADLGSSGGEDTLFGEAVVRRGGRIVAAGSSEATDHVPDARATREFVRNRTLSHGRARAAFRLRHAASLLGSLRARSELLTGAVVRIVAWTSLGAIARLGGDPARWSPYRRRRWFAWGLLQGAVGLTSREYGRHDHDETRTP